MTSLQKRTALQYQRKVGIPTFSPGLIEHIPLYEKALQITITVISVWGGNKRVYKSNMLCVHVLFLFLVDSLM